ncbi:MAG: FtsX-like permease family protein [Bacteroidetes bacterium]|nr:FtsX-like permease family protein [Bacteroidota bacterium]
MIKFLIKGVMKDRNRSLFPLLIVSIGVFLTVFLSCWLGGVLGDAVDLMAKFTTGHVKVMTKAYAENENLMPNDLALMDVDNLIENLEEDFPDLEWVERIRFGGLIDVPDEKGETKKQGPSGGLAIDMLSAETNELDRLNIPASIQRGHIPKKSGEALLSEEFAQNLELEPGDAFTLFGSTMYGSMTFHNFIVSGTVKFGSSGMDRGSVIIDLQDAKLVLDMEDAASEIMGYLPEGIYNDEDATEVAAAFNTNYTDSEDEFAPVMLRLQEQGTMAQYFAMASNISGILIGIFIMALAIVLWNTGLLNGLRRYNEFGIRLAMGEYKSHIYRSLIIESAAIGIIGSLIGTGLGLALSYYLQKNGLDFSHFMKNSSSAMMMPSVYRAVVSPQAFYIGFIPGVISIVLGNMLSGLGIYKRQTARLFKELEV